MKIDKTITIEELVTKKPESIMFLMDRGIKCIACGEPIWGTLEEAARLKGFSEDEISRVVNELNDL